MDAVDQSPPIGVKWHPRWFYTNKMSHFAPPRILTYTWARETFYKSSTKCLPIVSSTNIFSGAHAAQCRDILSTFCTGNFTNLGDTSRGQYLHRFCDNREHGLVAVPRANCGEIAIRHYVSVLLVEIHNRLFSVEAPYPSQTDGNWSPEWCICMAVNECFSPI